MCRAIRMTAITTVYCVAFCAVYCQADDPEGLGPPPADLEHLPAPKNIGVVSEVIREDTEVMLGDQRLGFLKRGRSLLVLATRLGYSQIEYLTADHSRVVGWVESAALRPKPKEGQSTLFAASAIEITARGRKDEIRPGVMRMIHDVQGEYVKLDSPCIPFVWVRSPELLPADLALLFFDRWVQEQPRDTSAYEARGIFRHELANVDGLRASVTALSSQELLEQSVTDLQAALERNPRNVSARFWLALSLDELHRDEEALEAFAATVHLCPEWTLPYLLRGRLHLRHGDEAKGVEDLIRAMTVDSTNSAAYMELQNLVIFAQRDDDLSRRIIQALKDYRHVNQEATTMMAPLIGPARN